MKRLLLVLLLIIVISKCSFGSPDSVETYIPDVVDELLYQNIVASNPQQAYQVNQQASKVGLLKDIWKFITSPFRPVWGKFEEPGHHNHGPYTVFQHHQSDIPTQVAAIRQKKVFHTLVNANFF